MYFLEARPGMSREAPLTRCRVQHNFCMWAAFSAREWASISFHGYWLALIPTTLSNSYASLVSASLVSTTPTFLDFRRIAPLFQLIFLANKSIVIALFRGPNWTHFFAFVAPLPSSSFAFVLPNGCWLLVVIAPSCFFAQTCIGRTTPFPKLHFYSVKQIVLQLHDCPFFGRSSWNQLTCKKPAKNSTLTHWTTRRRKDERKRPKRVHEWSSHYIGTQYTQSIGKLHTNALSFNAPSFAWAWTCLPIVFLAYLLRRPSFQHSTPSLILFYPLRRTDGPMGLPPPQTPPLLPPLAMRMAKISGENFFDRKAIWPKSFSAENCLAENLLGRKKFRLLGRKSFRPKHFSANFFFSVETIFGWKSFGRIIFRSKNFSFENFAVCIAAGGSNGASPGPFVRRSAGTEIASRREFTFRRLSSVHSQATLAQVT